MKDRLIGLMSIVVLAGPIVANADSLSFTYSNSSEANVSASFTVNVVGGLAQSGTGTITSTLWSGTEHLTLLTPSSTLPAGAGSINPTPGTPPYDLGSGFTWHTVPGSSGPDFLGDAVVNAAAAYVDDYGLTFAIIDPNTSSIVGGINLSANTLGNPTTSYTANLSANGQCLSCYGTSNGTLAISAVPEADTSAMILAGLGLVGLQLRRRRTGQHLIHA
jgi:PEP-CTERM motif